MKARGIFGSIEARGKFGDIMVAFPWKDVQVIRVLKYPAQPGTPLVVAQRLNMSNAIEEMKAALYTDADRRAQVRLASLRPKGETGPNQIVREYIRVARVPLTWSRLREGAVTGIVAGGAKLRIKGDVGLANVKVAFGTNIRYMYDILACNWDGVNFLWEAILGPGYFNPGDRVYFQFFDAVGSLADAIGLTGIYSYDAL